jgi:hypothetical protein
VITSSKERPVLFNDRHVCGIQEVRAGDGYRGGDGRGADMAGRLSGKVSGKSAA